MAVNKRAAGADKEQLAARYLVDNGYAVLERNFRNKTGEIDIIAKKDNYIVFVEVKYRSNNKYGYAVEAVNYRKQQIIRRVAQFYMTTRYKSCDIPCRFDVIGIDGETVTHIKNAF
ncbi:YraN family protein [Lachnospira eligens]|jgi:putative endonuclease|uniref:YraN family protein n=1 Tax=Lachnospira eligens TaxID=39485 RepID=UPI000E50D198|nr:YraN family protein [Lachnospira eligens]RGT53905.1 YraN family protein [Lachnospira eligens]